MCAKKHKIPECSIISSSGKLSMKLFNSNSARFRVFTALTLIASYGGSFYAFSDVKYSYAKNGDAVLYDGTKKNEAYDVAIRLSDPQLKGKKIIGMEVPAALSAMVTDYKGWISTELNLAENPQTGAKENNPDIAQKAGTIENGIMTVRFDTPYTIGDQSVYVGYSFNVAEVDSENDYDPAKFPIAMSQGATEGAMYLHTARLYKQWKDRSDLFNGTSQIRVLLDGDFKEADGAIHVNNPLSVSYEEKTINIPVKITNYGLNALSDLSFLCTVNGNTQTIDKKFDSPLESYWGQSVDINLQIPQAYEVGEYPMEIRLAKINGSENNNAAGTVNLDLHILQLLPKKLPVIEEYTGLWCGYCPQGIVAMEMLAKEYDDFIGIAIHSTDALSVTSDFPSEVGGYPTAYIDRKSSFSPKPTTIKEIYDPARDEYTCAALNVAMGRDSENKNKINLLTTLEFVEAPANDCLLAYMLLGNGLSDEEWAQMNYFSGKNDAYMDYFSSADKLVYGLTFDHAMLMYSDYSGVKNSVPAKSEIKPYQPISHSYTFDLSTLDQNDENQKKAFDLVNKSGDNLTAVALLIDQKTGTIVNAAKSNMSRAAVETIYSESAEVINIKYYNLHGVIVDNDFTGLCIKVTALADGTIKTEKIIKK